MSEYFKKIGEKQEKKDKTPSKGKARTKALASYKKEHSYISKEKSGKKNYQEYK